MRFRLALVIAGLSGFIALSYEIVWYRVLSVMTGGVSAAFGLLLAAYLLGLAFGSRAAGAFCKGEGGDPRELRLLSLFVAVGGGIAALVVPAFAWSAAFTDYRIGLLVVLVSAGFLGAVLPLVSHFGIEPDDRAGGRLSYVYLANIIGSASGSLLTGFVLMDTFSLHTIARLLLLSGFCLSAALLAMSGMELRRALPAYGALLVGSLLALSLSPLAYDNLYERLVFKNEWNGKTKFAEIIETKSGVITVTNDGTVYGGGAYDGVLNISLVNNELNHIVRAYAIGALHPAPKEVLVIGLSGGAWTQVVANLPGVEKITVIEINPGYLDVIAKHDEVKSLLTNPKVDIAIDDGRRWLQRHPDRRFDFVLMNTTMHWRDHATNVLSSDFMEIVRPHLAPGGIFYFNTTSSLDVQLTAAHKFPHVLRVSNFIAASDSPFFFDRDRWKNLLRTMQVEGKPALDLTTPQGQAMYDELAGYIDLAPRDAILHYYEPIARDVTDDNMVVEWQNPLRYAEMR